MREPRVAVVIPALDEEQALPLVLAEIPRPPATLVVVVDNGSRDRTAECARAAARSCSRSRGAATAAPASGVWPGSSLRGPGGPERAFEGGDVVVFLDADGSDRPEELARLVGPILRGEAELVLGSRVLGGARAAR
jgi:glycosyltransferase involved in cell wall biosynthesis